MGNIVKPLGFVILSHNNPPQLLRLIRTLNAMFDRPPIACHHDFSQSDLSIEAFPSNVKFVLPSIKTGWGKWSLVEGFLLGLRLLYAKEGPEWFMLISGSDYPAMRADKVHRELKDAKVDAFIDIHHLDNPQYSASIIGDWNVTKPHLENDFSHRWKWRFYVGAQIGIPLIRTKPKWRLGKYTWYLPFEGRSPYHARFKMFYGEQWFTANKRCAEILLNPTSDHLRLKAHLSTRFAPDECYCQTVLGNTPSLVLNRDNKRYILWPGGGAHPKALDLGDVPQMISSGNHFARKFAAGSSALDAIDDHLLRQSAPVQA